MADFRERFNELIRERGTMARLSETTKISTGLLSNYKNGPIEPSLPNSVLIADYFDVSLDWLAGREGFARDAHKGGIRPPLTQAERELLDSYDRMDEEDKPGFMTTARGLAYAGEAKKEGKAPDAPVAGIAVKEV